jgi:hypothetical protein
LPRRGPCTKLLEVFGMRSCMIHVSPPMSRLVCINFLSACSPR